MDAQKNGATKTGVQPIRILLATGLALVAAVQALLYLYWFERVAYPLTLQWTEIKSAEQIFNQRDPYYTVRKYLREHVRNSQRPPQVVLVGETVAPPSRFDLEVYYELYPKLPKKVVAGSPEFTGAVARAKTGAAFISEQKLALDPAQYKEIVGEQYYIYVRS